MVPCGQRWHAAAFPPASLLPPSLAAASLEPELLALPLEPEPPLLLLLLALASLLPAPSDPELASMTLGEPVDASEPPEEPPWLDPPTHATVNIAPHTINSTCVRLIQASCRRRPKALNPDGQRAHL